MKIKIFNQLGNERFSSEVTSVKEAEKLQSLHEKMNDQSYLYFPSSMRMAPEKRYEVKPVPVIKNHFAENGRVLSRLEIKRLNLA